MGPQEKRARAVPSSSGSNRQQKEEENPRLHQAYPFQPLEDMRRGNPRAQTGARRNTQTSSQDLIQPLFPRLLQKVQPIIQKESLARVFSIGADVSLIKPDTQKRDQEGTCSQLAFCFRGLQCQHAPPLAPLTHIVTECSRSKSVLS